MKKSLLVIAISCLVLSVSAQRPRTDQKEMMEKTTKELNLSETQIEQWQAIHEKYGEELKTARTSRNRDQLKEVRDKMDTELQAILDEDQLTKFQEMKEKRQSERPRRRD